MEPIKYADEAKVVAAHLMTPDLANPAGNVHGGHVVRLADNLAYACASRFAGCLTTTAAVDRVDFLQPVYVGELLNMVARVEYAGTTSMELSVEIHAENLTTGQTRHTNSCHLTLVAIRDGRPAPVPRLVPRSHDDKIRYLRALERRTLGRRYRDQRIESAQHYAELDDAALDALMADDS